MSINAGSTLFAAAALIYKLYTIFLPGDPILHEERSLLYQNSAYYGAGPGRSAFVSYSRSESPRERCPWFFAVSQKHLLWAAFNASRAIAFTPLYFLSPTIISRGALYALATLASTTWCNMTATTSADLESGDQIWLLTTAVLMASQVAPVALPAGLRGPSIPQAFPLLNAILFSGHQIVCVLHEGGINEQTAVVITGIKNLVLGQVVVPEGMVHLYDTRY
uniref:Uncharacterized protein n=1 Tax=Moniliophthora roreri TaxID=221103 RepID=A0A0W0FJM6_MONRR